MILRCERFRRALEKQSLRPKDDTTSNERFPTRPMLCRSWTTFNELIICGRGRAHGSLDKTNQRAEDLLRDTQQV